MAVYRLCSWNAKSRGSDCCDLIMASVDSKYDELLNNWLFQDLNAECFSCISTTDYFIGVSVSAKLWTTHLQFSLSIKKGKEVGVRGRPLEGLKIRFNISFFKPNLQWSLVWLFEFKCTILISVLLRRKC